MEENVEKQRYTFGRWLVNSASWCAFVFFVFLVLKGQTYGWVGIVVCVLWFVWHVARQFFSVLSEDAQQAFSDFFGLFGNFFSGKISTPVFAANLQLAQRRIENALDAMDQEAEVIIKVFSIHKFFIATVVISIIGAIIAFIVL